MKTLLIASESDLAHVDGEVQAVVNALHPTVLLGPAATSDALMHALREPYDLVWLAVHGDEGGIGLADGPLRGQTLTQFLRGHGETALFLNTCSSLGMAIHLHQELQAPVIATVSRVDDLVAYQTGATLANWLSQGRTLREAFELSRPGGDQQWVYLNDAIRMERRDRTDDLLALTYDMAQRQSDLQVAVAALRSDFVAYREWADRHYQRQLTKFNTRLFYGAYLAFSAVFLLALVQVREVLQLSWPAAAIIGLFLIGLALQLFLRGYNFPSPF